MGVFRRVFLRREFRCLDDGPFDHERGAGLGLQFRKFLVEALLGDAAAVIAVLAFVHGEFEEFLVVFAAVPAFRFHHRTELRKFVRIVVLRVAGGEFQALFLRERDDFRGKRAGERAHMAEDHAPGVLVDGRPARLVAEHVEQVHQRRVLHILAERGHERRIAEPRPNVLNLLEELDHQRVQRHFRASMGPLRRVDRALEAPEVGHHRAHHAARQPAAHQERGHLPVGRVDPVAEEIVDE